MNLLSIEKEAALCRESHKDSQVGDPCWHTHHKVLSEQLTGPAENRIAWILSDKSKKEQALRLHLFRPISKAFIESHEDLRKAWEDLQKAYADLRKAYDNRYKADADRYKARADWKKARADWEKAWADWEKAWADWEKADADWKKADADWHKIVERYHSELCPDCPWDGETIFPEYKK